MYVLCAVEYGDFEIFQSPLCVGPMLCCGDFEIFQSSHVCGLCAVVCEDFEFFKVPLCVKLCHCTGEIEFSRKNPCTGDFPLCWRDCFFRVKIPGGGAVKQ